MIDKIDEWLLSRFDRFVGWNVHRGRADQWDLARAALDMGAALMATSVAFSIYLAPRVDLGVVAISVLLPIAFGVIYSRQKTDIERLRGRENGAVTSRVGEATARRSNIFFIMLIALFTALSRDVDDVLFLMSMAVVDTTLYFKGALPPPPPTTMARTTLARQS